MCLAVPMRLSRIEGNEGIGEALGVSRRIRLDLIKEPKLGEYVIVHAGFAIERLSEEQARLDTAAWEEVQNALD